MTQDKVLKPHQDPDTEMDTQVGLQVVVRAGEKEERPQEAMEEDGGRAGRHGETEVNMKTERDCGREEVTE